MSARLVVLASGSGTNLQAIIDATAAGQLDAAVVAVVANVTDAYALERASAAGITAVAMPPTPDESRREYDLRLAAAVAEFEPDFVVLAGWMRLLRMAFLERFPQRVVNLHPALPGDLPGLHAIERAHAQFLAGQRTNTGVMVHLVPDEGVDDGPVLRTCRVPIEPGDTLDALAARVHAAEHRTLVEALRDLCTTDHSASFLEEAHPA
jgi:phosphoribosylglycinamide formyltransferase 1